MANIKSARTEINPRGLKDDDRVTCSGRTGRAVYVSRVVDRQGTMVRWDDAPTKLSMVTTSRLRVVQ
jgi:hypothetical protein